MLKPGEFIHTTERFEFPELKARATLDRYRRGVGRQTEYQRQGRTRNGYVIWGDPRYVDASEFDSNSLRMSALVERLGFLARFTGRFDSISDVAHLEQVPEDDAAKLAAVREQVEAHIRFSQANPSWKGA